jgi:hypothetical protein
MMGEIISGLHSFGTTQMNISRESFLYIERVRRTNIFIGERSVKLNEGHASIVPIVVDLGE